MVPAEPEPSSSRRSSLGMAWASLPPRLTPDTAERIAEALTCPICLDVAQLPVNIICFQGCGGTQSRGNTCLRSLVCKHCANQSLDLIKPQGERGIGYVRCLICRETRTRAATLNPHKAYTTNFNIMDVMDNMGMKGLCRLCGKEFDSQVALQSHYLRVCPYAVVQCRFHGCSTYGSRPSVSAHELTCPMGRARCELCAQHIDLGALTHHQEHSCRNRVVSCVLCSHRAPLTDMLQHLKVHQTQILMSHRQLYRTDDSVGTSSSTRGRTASGTGVPPQAGQASELRQSVPELLQVPSLGRAMSSDDGLLPNTTRLLELLLPAASPPMSWPPPSQQYGSTSTGLSMSRSASTSVLSSAMTVAASLPSRARAGGLSPAATAAAAAVIATAERLLVRHAAAAHINIMEAPGGPAAPTPTATTTETASMADASMADDLPVRPVHSIPPVPPVEGSAPGPTTPYAASEDTATPSDHAVEAVQPPEATTPVATAFVATGPLPSPLPVAAADVEGTAPDTVAEYGATATAASAAGASAAGASAAGAIAASWAAAEQELGVPDLPAEALTAAPNPPTRVSLEATACDTGAIDEPGSTVLLPGSTSSETGSPDEARLSLPSGGPSAHALEEASIALVAAAAPRPACSPVVRLVGLRRVVSSVTLSPRSPLGRTPPATAFATECATANRPRRAVSSAMLSPRSPLRRTSRATAFAAECATGNRPRRAASSAMLSPHSPLRRAPSASATRHTEHGQPCPNSAGGPGPQGTVGAEDVLDVSDGNGGSSSNSQHADVGDVSSIDHGGSAGHSSGSAGREESSCDSGADGGGGIDGCSNAADGCSTQDQNTTTPRLLDVPSSSGPLLSPKLSEVGLQGQTSNSPTSCPSSPSPVSPTLLVARSSLALPRRSSCWSPFASVSGRLSTIRSSVEVIDAIVPVPPTHVAHNLDSSFVFSASPSVSGDRADASASPLYRQSSTEFLRSCLYRQGSTEANKPCMLGRQVSSMSQACSGNLDVGLSRESSQSAVWVRDEDGGYSRDIERFDRAGSTVSSGSSSSWWGTGVDGCSTGTGGQASMLHVVPVACTRSATVNVPPCDAHAALQRGAGARRPASCSCETIPGMGGYLESSKESARHATVTKLPTFHRWLRPQSNRHASDSRVLFHDDGPVRQSWASCPLTQGANSAAYSDAAYSSGSAWN